MSRKTLAAAAIAGAAAHHGLAFAQDAGAPASEVKKIETLQVTVQRLDAARNSLSPDTGSTIYRFDRKDIEALPLGESTPLNYLLLQTPGVVQDSFGQLHLRGDHANLQYRINGVVIPEAISGFGQALDAHFADQIRILTGALPAQYGYRTAGVVDITTKSVADDNGGHIGYLGGSHSHEEANAELHGASGAFSYFLTGSYLQNDLGIENPTPEKNALHDHTRQQKGFGTLSYLLSNDSRVSFTFGVSNGKFEIPNSPGQDPVYTLAGTPPVASENLDARQNEKNRFEILTYQGNAGGAVNYQVSAFHRYTDVTYLPDPVGDLIYNGIAADILRKNDAYGIQLDASRPLGDSHTLRAGIYANRERFTTNNNAQVFPADDGGNQTSDVPINIVDNSRIDGKLFGIYLQDEWTPVPRLTVNYGVRYDKVNTVVDEQQLSPRLGVVYELSKDTRLHAGYARYFTPPPTEKIDTTSVQAFLGTTNALPSDANTAVKSERSNYFDVGISHQLTREITIGLDAYYRDVRHLQDEGQFGNALIFSAFNYERGKISGVELTSSYRSGPLSAYANLAFSSARGKGIETGQFNFDEDELAYIQNNWVHLDHEQRIAASAGASYKWRDTTFTLDAIYGSGLRRGFANTEHLPGYTQVNAAVVQAMSFASIGKLEARLAVVNLFDKTYELRDGSGIGVGAPQFGPRRAFYAGLTKYF